MISLIFLSFFAFSSPSLEAPNPYLEGVKLFQGQRYVDAIEKFKEADSNQPDNPFILYNWGASAFEVEQRGLAVGLWRRALFLEPGFRPAVNALRYAKEVMPDQVFELRGNVFQVLKAGALRTLSFNHLMLINLLLLAFSGWLLLKYFGSYRNALEDETPLPNFPSIGALFTTLFFVSSFFAGLKYIELNENRATVIAPDVELRTGPTENSNTVYSLLEGAEVIIEASQNDWTLVTYPGGMTGWVQKASLFRNSGSREW